MDGHGRKLGRRRRGEGLLLPAFDASLTASSFSPAAAVLHPCILVRAYNGNRNGLVSLLWSLLLSSHPNLRAFIVDTGKTLSPELSSIVRSVNALSGRDWVEVSRRTGVQDVKSQFPALDGVEDYGYALTDLVMEDIMSEKAGERDAGLASQNSTIGSPSTTCDTLTITNADNVYSPDFLRQTLGPIADEGKDMVGTNWVSHYDFGQRWPVGPPGYDQEWCGPHRSGKIQEIKASSVFQCGCIDLGAVTFRLKQVRQSGIRFIVDKLRANATLYDLPQSDCFFFQRLKAFGGETKIVHETLFVHN